MLRTVVVIELDIASVQQLLQCPDEREARRYPGFIGRCAVSFCLHKATVLDVVLVYSSETAFQEGSWGSLSDW